MDDKNGFYQGESTDSISFILHGNNGYPVLWTVWEDRDGQYHVFAEADPDTEDYLLDPDCPPHLLDEYHSVVEATPTAHSKWLSLINSFIAARTYNSIRPLIENENNWLLLNTEELDRD